MLVYTGTKVDIPLEQASPCQLPRSAAQPAVILLIARAPKVGMGKKCEISIPEPIILTAAHRDDHSNVDAEV